MPNNKICRYAVWCVAFLAPMAPLMGQTDTTLEAHVLPSVFDNSPETVAQDINDRGQIVGWSTDPTGSSKAVLWNAEGKPKQQNCPEGTAECWAVSINNRGTSVGNAVPTDFSAEFGFIVRWSPAGEVGRVATPSGLFTAWANDISDQGFVVGTGEAYELGPGPRTATFWWRNGTPSHKLQPLVGATGTPAQGSEASAINDNKRNSRLVVGYSSLDYGQGVAATVWDRSGKPTALPALDGDDGSLARSVNRDGTVAGVSLQDPEGEEIYSISTAVVWGDDGLVVALDLLPGCNESSALEINDAGFVVGYAGSCSGKRNQVAVVWNPEGEVFRLPLKAKFTSSRALAINSQGDIVGYAVNRNGKTVAIVWK